MPFIIGSKGNVYINGRFIGKYGPRKRFGKRFMLVDKNGKRKADNSMSERKRYMQVSRVQRHRESQRMKYGPNRYQIAKRKAMARKYVNRLLTVFADKMAEKSMREITHGTGKPTEFYGKPPYEPREQTKWEGQWLRPGYIMVEPPAENLVPKSLVPLIAGVNFVNTDNPITSVLVGDRRSGRFEKFYGTRRSDPNDPMSGRLHRKTPTADDIDAALLRIRMPDPAPTHITDELTAVMEKFNSIVAEYNAKGYDLTGIADNELLFKKRA